MFDIKSMSKLFWPVLIEQILATTIGMVNTMMVSNVGISAISAVGIVDSLNSVIMNLFIAFSTGATVIVAQRIGAKDYKKASKTASQAITSCVMIAILSGVAFIIFGDQIINLLFGKAEELVKSNAMTYLIFSGFSYPFLATFNMSAGILRASGDTKAPMRASILSNIINVGVGALCIFVLNLGVAGAGIALLASRISSAAILSMVLISPKATFGIGSFSIKLSKSILWPVLAIGVPASIDGLIFNGGKLLIQTLVTSLGTVALAANGVAGSVTGLINIPGNAVAVVAVTIIGQSVGAGVYGKELRKRIRTLIGYAIIPLVTMTLIIYPLLPLLLNLYAPPADVKATALDILHLILLFMPLTWPTAFILPSCIRSTGDSLFVTIVSILSMWFVRVLGAWVAVEHLSMGILGIWLFWCMDWVVRSIVFIIRARISKYINNPREPVDEQATSEA